MGPLKGPPHLSLDRCLPSGQSLSTSHRTSAAHAHGRGRRRSLRYVGVSPTPITECGTAVTTSPASSSSWPTAPQKGAGGLAEPACWSSCTSQSAQSRNGVLRHGLFPVPLTELQKQQSEDAARKLLRTLLLSCSVPSAGRLLAEGLSSRSGPAPGSALLGQSCHADVASAAALLPLLTWQWLSIADLEGWVDRGVAHLLRETLLVQKAATDPSASVNELVGWCLDNCSGSAAALAALWGHQQAQTLPLRCRSFYSLLLQRLGVLDDSREQLQIGVDGSACSRSAGVDSDKGVGTQGDHGNGHAGGRSLGLGGYAPSVAAQQAMVLCGSVIRTALSTSSRSWSSKELEDGVGTSEDEGGLGSNCNGSCDSGKTGVNSSGSSEISGSGTAALNVGIDADSDRVVLSKLPATAGLLLQESEAEQSGGGGLQQQQQAPSSPVTGRVDGTLASIGNGSVPYTNGSSVEGEGPLWASGMALEGSRSSRVSSVFTSPSTGAAASAEASLLDTTTVLGLQAYGESFVGPDGSSGGSGDVANTNAGGLAPGGVTRPTASLLQRPSRSPVVEPDLDPGAERSPETSESAATASSALGAGSDISKLDFLRSAVAPQQLSTPVRLMATGRFPLRDLSGAELVGLVVPETGPVVISNDPRVFPGTEAVLSDYSTAAGDKLAMRLEYITDRSVYDEVVLQLFNISRITRKRTENCLLYVNGKAVHVGDPGLLLAPGDEVWFGQRSFSFRVEAFKGLPSAIAKALRLYCNDATAAPSFEEDADNDAGPEVADAGFVSDGGETSSDELQYSVPSTSSLELSSEPDMAELSNLSRRDPRRAEAALRRLAMVKPGDAAVWLIWAQTAARMEGPSGQGKARLLFRAAVEAARVMEVIPPPPAALQVAAQRAFARRRGVSRRTMSTGAVTTGTAAAAAGGYDDDTADAYGYAPSVAGAASAFGSETPQRHNWLLVQALGNWAKHEWRLRMYGSARHLFRAAVDEAARHPDGVGGGGGGAILHYWASRELDALNVRNARIVATEGLRKCPADVALYVVAAGVELEGGNLEMAKTYCQRAYALDRTDKQLFLVWPRVEAALGDRLKARLLYERALDTYPLNTKIINLYARFETEEGSYQEAAELYDRALRIDPLSPVMGVHNRADWASMEADLGNLGLARSLLEGGLAAHPRSTPLLVTLAKVERLDGRYTEALRLVRAAQTIAGAFNVPVMTERSQVLRAMGEKEMAANLVRHVSSVKELNRMKQQGYWGSEAWRAFIEATRSAEQQTVVAAARERKQQLGWAPTVRGAKPQPTGHAGDGRRPSAPEAQQWLQLEHLRLRRAEARRIAAQREALMRALEEGDGGDAPSDMTGAMGAMSSRSSGDDEYDNYYDEPPVGVPSLDSVRRPMPGDEDVYDT